MQLFVVQTARASGLSLLYLAFKVCCPDDELMPVLTDGVPQLWCKETVYLNSKPTLDSQGKPRFLLYGDMPVALFGCPYDRHCQSLETMLQTYQMSLKPGHHYGPAWQASTYMPKGDYCEVFGRRPLEAALRCLVLSHLGPEAEVPGLLLYP